MCIEPEYLGIAGDTEESLNSLILSALQTRNVLILSGGVSIGDFDFVPKVLKNNGVNILFDKVAMQHANPMIFGIKDDAAVFAFSENPISTL
jgi:molybdopterin molybdotransferase